ncbi:putative CxxC motif protein [Halorubrum virus Serpecor1]|uniref:Putative CxxC motif protein n=1 Tax=Halorubrum virus Serpecor1 TaxID=2721757 RepID=A0A6G9RWB1_9CAUD|nr:putative CxxC motif protein [Halorubrum virus Serpecor1]QIR31273.1 putative CxxC motif protein [Halorubrum virus Serpecor1]
MEPHDNYPKNCPVCESTVEERSYGVRCSNFRCLWKRWWQDKLPMFSAKTHEQHYAETH